MFSCGVCFGQITFQKTYGGWTYDYGHSLKQTSDSGYIFTGFTLSFGAGGYDAYFVKTDVNGDLLWAKAYGGTGDDVGTSILQSSDGGYTIAGYTSSFGAGGTDVWLLKINSSGDTVWSKTYGGTNNETSACVQQTTDGGYIISGNTFSFGAGADDAYLIKTDNNGDTLWTKTYGGTEIDNGNYVEQTVDSGFIITGVTVKFGDSIPHIHLIKTKFNGDTLWTKTYGGINIDEAYSVHQTSDSGYIISGTTRSFGGGNPHVYMIKTDKGGNLLWSKTFGGWFIDESRSVQQTTDGGYIIAGTTQSFGAGDQSIYLIKTDKNGDTLWTEIIGGTGNDAAYMVEQTNDEGYVIGGLTISFGATDYNFYLVKTDANGNSGCYTEPTATQLFPFFTQVLSSTTIVGSPNTSVSSPSILVTQADTGYTICSSVGLAPVLQTPNSEIIISPNPTSSTFTVKNLSSKEKTMLEITNVIGGIVYAEKLIGKNEYFVDATFAKGIYFVRVNDVVRKLIIE